MKKRRRGRREIKRKKKRRKKEDETEEANEAMGEEILARCRAEESMTHSLRRYFR